MTQPEFGKRVKERRHRLGMSQSEVASEGLSTSYLSLLEAGRRRPTRKAAESIAGRLGVDAEYLLSGQGKTTRAERDLDVRFAELALANGDVPEALRRLADLTATADAGDPDCWRIRHATARAWERAGDLEQAVEILEGLRERAERDPARWPWLEVVIDLSRCYRETGDLARAVQVAEQAAEHARAVGLDACAEYPRLVVTLAGASRERGDHAYAAQLLARLLGGLPDEAPRGDRGAALWNAALIAAERGRFADGVGMAERALAHFAEQDEVRADGLLRMTLAWMLLEWPDGDARKAEGLLRDARQRLIGAGMQIEAAYTETELARASVQDGDAPQAMDWARSALARLGDGDRLETARARLALARALFSNSEDSAAIEEMTRAAEALEEHGAGRQAAAVWRDLAELHTAVGDTASAAASFARALDLLGIPARRPLTRNATRAPLLGHESADEPARAPRRTPATTAKAGTARTRGTVRP